MKFVASFALVLSSMAFAGEAQEENDNVNRIAQPQLNCPQIYNPTTCSYDDLAASGNNSCYARAALNVLAASKGVEIDSSKVVCQTGI